MYSTTRALFQSVWCTKAMVFPWRSIGASTQQNPLLQSDEKSPRRAKRRCPGIRREGAPGTDELGGRDVQDVLSISQLASSLGSVDRDNLFLAGESRGGMMTYQAMRYGFPARAAAVTGASTDQAEMLDKAPEMRPIMEAIWLKAGGNVSDGY